MNKKKKQMNKIGPVANQKYVYKKNTLCERRGCRDQQSI